MRLRKLPPTLIPLLSLCLLSASFAAAEDTPAPHAAAAALPDAPTPAPYAATAALPDAPTPGNPSPGNSPAGNPPPPKPITEKNLIPTIVIDQTKIWTSPFRLQTHDLFWLVPLAAATAASAETDHHVMTDIVSHDKTFNKDNVNASNYLLGVQIAIPAFLYADGVLGDHSRPRETGLLTADALGDGIIFQEVIKVIARRERPLYDHAHGKLFKSTSITDGSFPSSHSVLAWATAAVVAEEYPGRWPTLGVYTLATGVSLTRVLGQEHFPTDVLVGSAAGWLIGHYVYKAHHASWTGYTLQRKLRLGPEPPRSDEADITATTKSAEAAAAASR